MDKRLLAIPMLVGLVSTSLFAGEQQRHNAFRDKARVVDVTPLYEVVEVPVERRECWVEERTVRSSNGGGALVGGIIGGVIGHQFGAGEGRKLATVAGGVIGATVGSEAERQSRRNEPYREEVRRCQPRTDYVQEQRLRAYQVTYRYHGETFVTEMDREPGKFVTVRVAVSLID